VADISGPFDLETGPTYAADFEYREVIGRCGHQRVMELDGWVRRCDDCGDAAYDDSDRCLCGHHMEAHQCVKHSDDGKIDTHDGCMICDCNHFSDPITVLSDGDGQEAHDAD
jgi:hypothetical protein